MFVTFPNCPILQRNWLVGCFPGVGSTASTCPRIEGTKRPVAEVICSSSLLLSVYRLPKLYRLLTAEVDEALTRDTYDWDLRGKIWEEISLVSRMVFFLASKSFCRNRLSDLGEDLQEIGELCLDVPLLPFLLILLFTLWRSDVVLQEIWKAEDNCPWVAGWATCQGVDMSM